MIPFVCTVAAFAALVGTLAGEPFDAAALWAIFAVGLAGMAVVFVTSRNDYKKPTWPRTPSPKASACASPTI